MDQAETPPKEARAGIARAFTFVEDVVYIGLGLLLAGTALVLLGTSAVAFARAVASGSFATSVNALLDRILLVLLIVELLYTVQVSFREHALVPEPFLLVGLIAAIRRVLVLTAEFGEGHERTEGVHRFFVTELGVLTVLILALVASLMMLRSRGAKVRADRA